MIKSLEALRIIAFLFIFFHHLGYYGFAAISVSFFFILAGFLTYYNHYHEFMKLDSKTIINYYVAKFLRFYPLYFLTFILSIPTMYIWKIHVDFKIVTLHLLMMQSWFFIKNSVFMFNAVSWFISSLLFLILISPFIIYILTKVQSFVHTMVATVLLWFISCVIAYEYSGQMKVYTFGWWFIYISPYFTLFNFTIGILSGKMFTIIKNKVNNKALLTCLEFMALGYLIISYKSIYLKTDSLDYSVYYTPALALIIVIFSLQKGFIASFISNDYMVKLGKMTFATYMSHQLVIFYISIFLYPKIIGSNFSIKHILYQFLALVITAVIGFVLYKFSGIKLGRLVDGFSNSILTKLITRRDL